MQSEEIIRYIAQAKKRTPLKVYLRSQKPIAFPKAKVFGAHDQIIIGEQEDIIPILQAHESEIIEMEVEAYCRNSAVPLLDITSLSARIEPGAIIRDHVTIGEHAVIMMGAIINIGAQIGAHTMIDMGAIIGGRAIVGSHCHIGAGAVLAGVVEPASAKPVKIGDHVMIGANAVILEGIEIKEGAVIAAGAVVISDVAANSVVAGVPAKYIKQKDEQTETKTAIIDALRQL